MVMVTVNGVMLVEVEVSFVYCKANILLQLQVVVVVVMVTVSGVMLVEVEVSFVCCKARLHNWLYLLVRSRQKQQNGKAKIFYFTYFVY